MDKKKTHWTDGYGVITHTQTTRTHVESMLSYLVEKGMKGDDVPPGDILSAADRIASAAMWLVVHCTYAKHVYLDGRMLAKDDFKKNPEGHTGGALNMVPAYVGYMAINALMGKTRAWTMEQGHTVNAIDSVNLLLGNMTRSHADRYDVTDEGLTHFTRDFYSFKLNDRGVQDSPLGSHVNQNTAGGFMEGGYLGFTGIQYVHIPLPHERLVVFLSDGAFEEQRGGDWVPRFWRAEDSGLIIPIMIANGRRIDQRSTISQEGGVEWLEKYLRIHHFDPIVFDGRDPAAFSWAIFDIEHRLKQYVNSLTSINQYPVPIPYGIAVAPKGAGFYGEGTNDAHNLPLGDNPYEDASARERFNVYAKKLWVPPDELKSAIALFRKHDSSNRIREKDHQIADRHVEISAIPELRFQDVSKKRNDPKTWTRSSPIAAIDKGFVTAVTSNPDLRPRVGNPDEMRSNRMELTLEALKFRTSSPEAGNFESTLGGIISVLNEEAIAGAAFGNKGGINIIVTYEAFGAKIWGEARQEITFAQHQKEAGHPAMWLSVPLILTSHVWENGKNEQSHQDPSMAECMLGETSDISRVFFPPDYNACVVLMHEAYSTHGQIWTIITAKRKLPDLFAKEEAHTLLRDGGINLGWAGYEKEKAELTLVAVGAYQLVEVLKASERLAGKHIPHAVSYIQEPGRFRNPRNVGEEEIVVSGKVRDSVVPPGSQSVILVTHTRPEPLIGILQPLLGKRDVAGLGFINVGGTLDADGMLFVNKCSWSHILSTAMQSLNQPLETVLTSEEREVLAGKRSPDGITKLVVEI